MSNYTPKTTEDDEPIRIGIIVPGMAQTLIISGMPAWLFTTNGGRPSTILIVSRLTVITRWNSSRGYLGLSMVSVPACYESHELWIFYPAPDARLNIGLAAFPPRLWN
jgi:hypothetical protein